MNGSTQAFLMTDSARFAAEGQICESFGALIQEGETTDDISVKEDGFIAEAVPSQTRAVDGDII